MKNVVGKLMVALCLQVLASLAMAGTNNGLVYHGRILKPDGLPLDSGTATYTLEIWGRSDKYWDGAAPQVGADRCLLYQETHTKSMTGSFGAFELMVGEGTGPTWGVGAVAADKLISKLFVNYPYNSLTSNVVANKIKAISCSNSSASGNIYYPYNNTAAGLEQWVDREFVVAVNTGSASFTLPAMPIRSTPYALQAAQVAGYSPYNLFKIDGSSSNVFSVLEHDFLWNFARIKDVSGTTCADGEILKVVGGVWKCAVDAGGAGVITSVTASSPLAISGTTTPDIRISNGTVAGQTLRWNGTSWAITGLGISDISGTVPISQGGTGTTTAPTNGQILIGGTAGYVPANITAGSGISISNTSGAISISTMNLGPTAISAAGNANQVAIYTAGGVLSGENQLAPSRGGTGLNPTPTSGGLLIGTGDGQYNFTNLTAGTGINITNVSGGITISSTATPGAISGTGTANYLAMFNSGTSIISAPVYVSSNGNVGIGTTVPDEKAVVRGGNFRVETANSVGGRGGVAVHIANTANERGTYRFGLDNIAIEKGLQFDRDSGRISLINDPGAAISERLTVLPGGNVGIGTNSPAAKLDVQGTAYIGTTNAVQILDGFIKPYNAADSQSLEINSTKMNVGQVNSMSYSGANTALFNVGSATDATELIRLRTNTNAGYVTMSQANVNTFNMNFVQNGASQFYLKSDGNVGIGTTAPGSLLDVYSTTVSPVVSTRSVSDTLSPGFVMQRSRSGGGYPQVNDYLGDIFFRSAGQQQSARISVSASENHNAGAVGSTMQFWTTSNGAATGSVKMTINNAGNVGIGLTSPSARLNIISGSTLAGTAPLKITSGSVMTTPEAGAIEYDGNNLYYTDGTATRRALATAAAVSGAYVAKTGDTMTGALGITISGAPTAISVVQGGAGYAATFMGGNVGIGTTAPSVPLEVSGATRMNGNLRVVAGQAYVTPQTSSVATPLAFDTDGGNMMTWTTNDANPVVNINNMKAGGSYMVIIRGTGTGAATLNCWSGVGSGVITSSFMPANGPRTTNASIYNVMTDGSYCYITWVTGFN